MVAKFNIAIISMCQRERHINFSYNYKQVSFFNCSIGCNFNGGKIKRPLNPEKTRQIRGSKIVHTEGILEKRKILKKSDATPKIIKKVAQSSVKEQKEKTAELKPSTQKAVGVPVKLDAKTARIVDSELQDIMIKVWQQLPDNPTNEADKLVVEKFRNNAGDSLRNMLGLNVTKRLLNVFNILYLKLECSSLPRREDVIKMMRKYKLRGLKRIQSRPIVFSAYVNTIEDYDILCSEKVIKCGTAKVLVKPVYKFDKRPKNVITNFDDKDITGDDIPNINQMINKTPVVETKAQENEKETKEDVKIEKQESPKVKNAEEDIPKPEDKPKPEQKPLKPDGENSKKLVQISDPPKPQRKNVKTATKIIGREDIYRKITSEETKKEGKKSEQLKFKDNSSIKNVFKEGNDFDELDDDTILALMSEGVVVDECSGSEE